MNREFEMNVCSISPFAFIVNKLYKILSAGIFFDVYPDKTVKIWSTDYVSGAARLSFTIKSDLIINVTLPDGKSIEKPFSFSFNRNVLKQIPQIFSYKDGGIIDNEIVFQMDPDKGIAHVFQKFNSKFHVDIPFEMRDMNEAERDELYERFEEKPWMDYIKIGNPDAFLKLLFLYEKMAFIRVFRDNIAFYSPLNNNIFCCNSKNDVKKPFSLALSTVFLEGLKFALETSIHPEIYLSNFYPMIVKGKLEDDIKVEYFLIHRSPQGDEGKEFFEQNNEKIIKFLESLNGEIEKTLMNA
ncbi:MAG: hypothetical protein ACTSYS_14055 [Promethearchaeota archaeon]